MLVRPLLHDRHHSTTSQQAKNFQPTTTGDTMVHLLSRQPAWTNEMRHTYAELRHELGRDDALLRLEISPQNVTVLRQQVSLSINRQDWDTATVLLQRILAIYPNDVDANYQMGLVLLPTRPDEAAPHFSQASMIRQELNDTIQQLQATTSLRSLGLVLLRLDELPFAERAFTLAIQQDNQDWASYAYRGYIRDQRNGDGRTDLETAVGLSPASALPYYFLGLHWRQDNPDAAYDAFIAAYSLEPDNPAFAVEVGNTLIDLGNIGEAKRWFDIAVALAPDDVRWYRLQAAFYADNNFQLDEGGLEIIQAAHQRFPNDAHLLASLGYTHYWLQNTQEALDTFEQALDIDPDDARTHYYYALTLHRQGSYQSASYAYQTTIDLAGSESGYGYLASRALEQLSP